METTDARPGLTLHTPFAVNIEMWFGKLSFAQKIRRAAELGYQAVEFWFAGDQDMDAMRAAMDETGVTATQFTAWGFWPGLNDPASDHEEFLAKIREACELAARLDVPMFTVVAGDDVPGASREAMHEAVIRGLKLAAPICEKAGRMMILEPMSPDTHPGHCLYGSAEGIAICKAVNSPMLRLNWDFYHMQRFEGNLVHNLHAGKEWVGYLQLADSPERMEPGTGEVYWPRVFQAIREIGYTLPVGLECDPQGNDDVRAARRIRALDAAWEPKA